MILNFDAKVFRTEIELKESQPREEKSINPVAEPQINLNQSKKKKKN